MIELKPHPDHLIELGTGDKILSRGLCNGMPAFFIEPTDDPRPPGRPSQGPGEPHPHGDQTFATGSMAITFGCRESLICMIEVLQDLLDSDAGKAMP